MAATLVRQETAVEYFRELVDATLQRRHLEAGTLTSFYLVNLLAGFVHFEGAPASSDEPLGVRYLQSLHAAGPRQREGLREVGDRALFVSGFCPESLTRRLVDVDYYVDLGARAYGSLARREDDTLHDVFEELAANFVDFVDVLGDISEQASLTSNGDLMRLYERWLRTGSRRAGELLVARGIVPSAQGTARRVH